MKPVRTAILALVACVAAALAHADTVIVRAGKMLDVESGQYLADRAIRIEDGRVVSVTPWAASSRSGDRFIDWSAHTVLPGLIDLHTHLVGDISSADVNAPLSSSAARDALMGVEHARATLNAGFTAVRDIGTYRAFVDVALRNAINARQVEGPCMFVAGAYVTVPGGGGEVTGLPDALKAPAEMRRGVAENAEQVRQRVRELIAGGADFIKIMATGAVLTAGTTPAMPEFTEAEIRAAVEEAARHGTFVAAHAHGAEGIKNAVRAGVRTIEHGSFIDEPAMDLMIQKGTWLIPTFCIHTYFEEQPTVDPALLKSLEIGRKSKESMYANMKLAVKKGVKFGLGSDNVGWPPSYSAREFVEYVGLGMTPMQAIQCGTKVNAEILGREKELGTIEPGKLADIIAVKGDPLKDISELQRVKFVMANGKIIRNEK